MKAFASLNFETSLTTSSLLTLKRACNFDYKLFFNDTILVHTGVALFSCSND